MINRTVCEEYTATGTVDVWKPPAGSILWSYTNGGSSSDFLSKFEEQGVSYAASPTKYWMRYGKRHGQCWRRGSERPYFKRGL